MLKLKNNVWKGFMLILILVFLLCFSYTGLADQEIKELRIVSGSVGGNWYPVACAIAEYFNQDFGKKIAGGKPGGGLSNPISVSRGDFEAGISYSCFLLNAEKGVAQYEEKHDNNKAVVGLFPVTVHIMADKSLPYDDLGAIIENKYPMKLSACRPNNSDYWLAEKILEEYGVTFDDIKSWGGEIRICGAGEAASLYKDKHINVIFRHGAWPSADLLEVAFARPSKLIKISDEVLKKMVEKYDVAEIVVPANTYKGIDYDYKTISMGCELFCRKDIPDEIIYQLTKTVIENKERLSVINPQFKRFDPNIAWKALGIELHPGAEKYFKEKGYMK